MLRLIYEVSLEDWGAEGLVLSAAVSEVGPWGGAWAVSDLTHQWMTPSIANGLRVVVESVGSGPSWRE